LGALFLCVIVPTAILLFAGVRSGRWRDADVSVREERRRFYPWAIPFSALGALALWLMRVPGFVLRGAVVTLILFCLAGLINLRSKISLHILFAFYCATILLRLGLIIGTTALVVALLVFWSRLFLGRHTWFEAAAGACLGIAGGIVTAWWP
jgi:membrane-associated phospholipid phosphatase